MNSSSHSAPDSPTNGEPPNGEPTLDLSSDPSQPEISPFDAVVVDATAIGAASPLEIASAEALTEAPTMAEPEVLFTEPYVEPRGSRWPLVIFLLLLIGGGAGGWFYFKTKAEAREARRWAPIVMPERLAIIPTDWGVMTLATRLKKSDKIRDEAAFVQAAREVKLNGAMPGGYLLPKVAGPRDLARVFKAGPTHEKAVFPPGFTGMQIVARLKKAGFGGAAQMEKLIYPTSGFSPYEGTLGPDTYWMPLRADGKTLIGLMQDDFHRTIEKLPKTLPVVNGKPLTTREVVTLASLIEREANRKDEMPLMAGVMINRLQKPMRLQVDATVQYARLLADKDHKSRLLFEDLKIQSPFNTYLNDGLPPTPICNPGVAALMAAARPAKTDALFYVYSPRLKKHIFAPDFEGHKHNVAIARRERDALAKEHG